MYVAHTSGVDSASGAVGAWKSSLPPPSIPNVVAGRDVAWDIFHEVGLWRFAAKRQRQAAGHVHAQESDGRGRIRDSGFLYVILFPGWCPRAEELYSQVEICLFGEYKLRRNSCPKLVYLQ